MRSLLPPESHGEDALAAFLARDRTPSTGRPWVMANMVASVDGAWTLNAQNQTVDYNPAAAEDESTITFNAVALSVPMRIRDTGLRASCLSRMTAPRPTRGSSSTWTCRCPIPSW